jgi:hypothetical protein
MSRMRCWIGSECNNGIKDRGLKQKLQGIKQIKDQGGRLLLCPRNERTSSWTYRKTIDRVKIAKQKAGCYAASRKIKDWTLWRGRPPLKRKKKETAQRGEAGNVEALATSLLREVINRTLAGVTQDECTLGGSGGSGWRVITAT